MEKLSNLNCDNVVEYRLYSTDLLDIKNTDKCMEELHDRQSRCIAHLSHFLIDYIWQNESFHLQVIPPTGQSVDKYSSKYCDIIIISNRCYRTTHLV